MIKIKKGDIVVRKSHGKDIIFYVKRIIKNKNKDIAILCGLLERLEADSKIDDLEKIDKQILKAKLKEEEEQLNARIAKNKYYSNKKIETRESSISRKLITGKILHLDGDRRYSRKSFNFYKKLGLNAVVKNIPENRQSSQVYQLLQAYNPDILVITGHDAMIRKDTNYNDVYNYRNSKYFINTVKEARRFDKDYKRNTVIFAGACQSYFEALILAGADFASSPGRILIDFIDPLIVAEKVATTEYYKYISIEDVIRHIKEGKKGIGGIGSNGRMRIL